MLASVRLVSLLVLMVASTVLAAWPDDPAANLPVSLADGVKSDVFAVTDGAGGAIIAWEDERAGTHDIYVQRVSADGETLWTADGVAVVTAGGDQSLYHSSTGTTGFSPLVADGSGGAWIVWQDARAFTSRARDIYVQRVDADGNLLFATNGIAVAAATGMEDQPTACLDGSGGLIVVWQDKNDDPVFFNIYGQRLDATGQPQWNSGDPLPIVVWDWDQDGPTVCADGHGGAFVAWSDSRVDVGDVYAQHVDHDGNHLWTPNGVAVCARDGGQDAISARLSSDQHLLLAWVDRRGAGPDIYAQKLDADSGANQWTAGGYAVCNAGASQYRPAMGPDLDGGAFVAWFDYRNASGPPWNLDIYAQQVTSAGAGAWDANGVSVCSAPDAQRDVDLVVDGSGGVFLAWEDNRIGTGYEDIYAQWLDSDGAAQWETDGKPISVAPKNQQRPDLVLGAGGVIIAWPDDREVLYEADVYCARVQTLDPMAAPVVRADSSLRLETRGEPAAGRTVIAFAVDRQATVTVGVFDVRGRRVRSLLEASPRTVGWHDLTWDHRDQAGRTLPSGVYLIQASTRDVEATARVLIVR